jgi:hypothetical protein
MALAAMSSPSTAQTPAPQAPAPPPADPQEVARRLLAERGLTPAGRHWLCAEDVRLRRQLDSLERLLKQFHQSRRALDQAIEENDAAARLLAEAERNVAAQQQLLAAATDAATRRKLGEELARLKAALEAARTRYRPPQQFAEDAGLRTTLLDWIGARNSLAIIALNYSEALARVSQRYEKLRSDAEVQQALATLGKNGPLGGGRNLAAAGPQIDDVRRLALAAEAPLYRVSETWRSSLLIGNATSAACTLADTGPVLVLPETVARAAGVALDEKTPRRKFTAPDGRQLDVRVVKLRHIRLGPRTLSNVETLVLPPEAEDLGVVFNYQHLGSQRAELQPQRLRIVFK